MRVRGLRNRKNLGQRFFRKVLHQIVELRLDLVRNCSDVLVFVFGEPEIGFKSVKHRCHVVNIFGGKRADQFPVKQLGWQSISYVRDTKLALKKIEYPRESLIYVDVCKSSVRCEFFVSLSFLVSIAQYGRKINCCGGQDCGKNSDKSRYYSLKFFNISMYLRWDCPGEQQKYRKSDERYKADNDKFVSAVRHVFSRICLEGGAA